MSVRRTTLVAFVAGGLAVALSLAFFLSPRASSSPDGLEKVAMEKGFIDAAEDSAVADGPLADYAVSGVEHESFSTGLAGLIGVAVTFAVACGIAFAIRALAGRRQNSAAATR